MRTVSLRTVRLLAVAVGLTVAALVYLDAQRPAAGQAAGGSEGVAEQRAGSADEAEAAIARAALGRRMEAALGDAFGGVWFEPSTAQMHVGVTSPQSRRRAEEIAARAGLSGIVAETAVDSTWQQLEAAQQRWDDRLGSLFGRGEVTTALAPDLNAVKINLGSAVSTSRRDALERETADATVAVRIESMPYPSLLVRPDQKRCASWIPSVADCNPPIAGGVAIEAINAKATCTAGPAVIRTDRTTAVKATETLLLTAGHCVHDHNGVGEKWRAFNKAGEGKDIGEAEAFLFGGTDLGVIKVDQSYWAAKTATPVSPGVAIWEAQKETDPFPVKKAEDPMEGAEVCYSATWGGTECGEVIAVGETIEYPSGVKMHNTVKVNFEGTGKALQGDSGAPWYASAASGIVHGIHIASHASTGIGEPNRAWFQPLSYSLEQLTTQKGLELELLTTANEKRKHPVVTAAKYPVTFSAKDTSSEDELTAFGSAVNCSEHEFHGEMTEAQQQEEPTVIELTPTYEKCLTGSGGAATVTNNECKYRITVGEDAGGGAYSSVVDLVCPAGKAGIQVHGAACMVTLPPQTGLKGPTLTNSGNNIVLDSGTIEGIKAKTCFFETTMGVLHIDQAVTVSGSGGGEAVKIDIGGE